MEVVIATAIMGIMFAAVFALQSSVTRSVMWVTYRFERILHARSFLVESAEKMDDKNRQDEVTFDKKINRPATDLQYKQTKIVSDELFGKKVHDLYKQQVTITWTEGTKKQHDVLVRYIYQPKKQPDTQKKTPSAPSKKEGAAA